MLATNARRRAGTGCGRMKVTAERIPEAQVVLDIELDDERVERSLNQAARRLSQRYRIPGFRKGKAPRQVVERALSVDAVFEEAAERMLPQAVQEALDGEGLETIAPPQVEVTAREPVTLRVTVPLPPTIELGDYRSIAVARPESGYSEDLVDEQVLSLRRRHALLEPVERAPQLDDQVTADLRAVVGEKEVLDESGAEFFLREGQQVALPGLLEQLLGLEIGVEHQFELDVEADWPDEEVAGQTVAFHVTIHEVKQEELPDPDDDFAMEVSDEFETFAELRARIADQLREGAEQQVKEQLRVAVLQAAIAKATLEYPPALVEHEVEHMRQEFARQMGQDPATFLRDEGEQGEQLMASFRAQANDRVINTLVLEEAAKAEQIAVTDEEVEADLEELLLTVPEERAPDDAVRERMRLNIRERLVRERTVERLEQIALANHDAGLGAADEASDDDSPEEAQGGAQADAAGEQPDQSEQPDSSEDA